MKNNKTLTDSLLICACGSKEHQIIIQKDDDCTDFVYMTIHLAPLSFFKRLKLGIKYIFGYRSIYGEFEEFIFDRSHVKSLKKLIKHLEYKK